MTEKIFQALEKSKTGLNGFEALKKAMLGADRNLKIEILEALKPVVKKNPVLTPLEIQPRVAVTMRDPDDFYEDVDHPQGRKIN
jgi:hypothetical protein